MNNFPLLLNSLVSTIWAMRPDAFEQVIKFLQGCADPETMACLLHYANAQQYREQFAVSGEDISSVQKKVDPRAPGTRRATVRGNVAILEIGGPIFPKANINTISGGTVIDTLATDLNALVENDKVDTIIHKVDSPGGVITGINEYSKMLLKAREKGNKTISFIEGQGASAAYYILSHSHKVYMEETAICGSIGVCSAYTSTEEADKKKGIQHIDIVSTQSPLKNLSPVTDEGKAHIQSIIDKMAEKFITAIAKARGVEVDIVKSDFGRGGMLVSDEAIAAGMADGIDTLEGLIESNYKNTNTFFGGYSMGITREQLKSEEPEVYKAILDEGRALATEQNDSRIAEVKKTSFAAGKAKGIETENARLLSLEDLDITGSSEIIAEAKKDPTKTTEEVSIAIVKAQKSRQDDLRDKRSLAGKDVQTNTKGTNQGSSGGENEAEDVLITEAVSSGADFH